MFGVLGLIGAPRLVHGYSVELDASVTGQAYDLRGADASYGAIGDVHRRRVTSAVGLRIAAGRKDRDGLPALRDQFTLVLNLRVDSDFGDYLCSIGRAAQSAPLTCLGQSAGGARTDPELSNYRPELLLAYVEGRDLGGLVTLRLGRQTQWQLYDLRGLDGVSVEVKTPIHVALEGFGGLSVNGNLPIDPSIYALDGTSRRVRLGQSNDAELARLDQTTALQPTFGFVLRSFGLRDFQAQLSYRRTLSETVDPAAPGCLSATGMPSGTACAPASGVIEDHLQASAHGRLLGGRLQGFGGLRYDLASARIDDGLLGLRGLVRTRHALSAEYRYSAPSWDLDSIWSVFSSQPYHHVQAAYDGLVPGSGRGFDVRAYARGFARIFQSVDRAGVADRSLLFGGNAGVRLDRRRGFLRLDGYVDAGYSGLRAGADLSGRVTFQADRFGLEGRLLYTYFASEQRAQATSHGLSIQAGARVNLFRGALLHVLLEDSIDRFYFSQLRAMAAIDLSYVLGPRGGGMAPVGMLAAGHGVFPAPGLQPSVLTQ